VVNPNYTSEAFPEEERFRMYHEIMKYPAVSKFLTKKGRNSKKTEKNYRTSLCVLEKFLDDKYNKMNIEQALRGIKQNKIDVYDFLEEFTNYMLTTLGKSANTTKENIKAVKSFLRGERIALDGRMVTEVLGIPKTIRGIDEALDKVTISKILQSVTLRRLKVFLFCLASSGCRVKELCSIRWCDINFDTKPVSLRLRAGTTKTRQERITFVSDEAVEELRKWKEIKSNQQSIELEDFVFQIKKENEPIDPTSITFKMSRQFAALLQTMKLTAKKNKFQHSISLHSFRKYFKTTISFDAKEPDLAELLIGHKSLSQTYFRMSPKAIATTYYEKLMPFLTFCDVASLEESRNDIAQELAKKDLVIASTQRQMEQMKQQMDLMNRTQEELKLLLKNPRRLVEILDRESKAK
jgi:integrase